jgi:hypothetical protein
VGALAAVVGVLGGAAVFMKRSPVGGTASSAQVPSLSVPAATSAAVVAPALGSSPGPRAAETVATLEAPTPSTAPSRRPGATRPLAYSPLSTPPVAKASTTAQPAPAPAPSCHVAQYFDSEGEVRFKRECP